MKIKVSFIINGSRKLSTLANKAIDFARTNDELDCHFTETEFTCHAIELAKQSADNEFDAIIAVGGDGTCNEVVNGIQQSERRNDVLFGIIPNGTGNDFHKMLGEFDPQRFVKNLIQKKSKMIDVISVEINDNQRYALNIAGIGFDGHVVNSLNNMREKFQIKGKIAYSLAILKSFIGFRKLEVQIKSDSFSYFGKLLMMVVCNGKAFGHGLIVSPDSEFNDGKLNVVLLGEVSFFDYIRNISKLKKGEKVDHPNVHYYEITSLEIMTKVNHLFTETDGEIFGQGDAKFEIRNKVLKLLS